MIKILILNQHSLNFGDDAARSGMRLAIDRFFPNADIRYILNMQPEDVNQSLMPDSDREYHFSLSKTDVILTIISRLIPSFILRLCSSPESRRMAQMIEESDLVIISPCGANIGKYRDWRFLSRVTTSVLLGKKPVFHSCTIGSSGNIIFDKVAKYVLKHSIIVVREMKSYDYLKSLDIGSTIGVDTAFIIPPISAIKRNEIILIPTELSRWFKGYSGYDLGYIEDIILDCIVNASMKYQLSVRILPHLYGRLEEGEFLRRFGHSLLERGVQVYIDSEYMSFEDYDRAIARAKIVVSMRYHGIVLSAKNSVPFVSLAYENKMIEVARYCGVPNQAVDIVSCDREKLYNLIEKTIDFQDEIMGVLIKNSERNRELAALPSLMLRHIFNYQK